MKLNSAREVIDHYGGNEKFAKALRAGYTRQAVNNWYRDNKFPASSYVLIIGACDLAGVYVPNSVFAMRLTKETPMSNGTVWTPLMEKRLEKLIDDGVPYKVIAETMSAEFSVPLTKNSCIGKGRRLGVSLRIAPRKRQCQAKKKRRRPAKRGKKKAPAKPRKKKRKPAAPAQPDPAPATPVELPLPDRTQSAI